MSSHLKGPVTARADVWPQVLWVLVSQVKHQAADEVEAHLTEAAAHHGAGTRLLQVVQVQQVVPLLAAGRPLGLSSYSYTYNNNTYV